MVRGHSRAACHTTNVPLKMLYYLLLINKRPTVFMLVMILSRIMFLAVWKFRTLANHHSASTQPLVPSRHERFTVVNRVVNRGSNETTKRFTMFISEMNSQKFGENFIKSVKYQATIRLPTTSHRTLPEISLTFSTFLRFFISS